MTRVSGAGSETGDGSRKGLRIPLSTPEWIFLISALLGALLLGRFVVLDPGLLTLDSHVSALSVAAFLIILLMVGIILVSTDSATAILVILIFLNLSDVLIRAYGLPSILQLVGIPILISAWIHHGPGLDRRLLGEPLTWALTAYTLFTLMSSTWASQPALADGRSQEFMKALLLYGLLVLLVTTPRRARITAWAMVGSGAFVSILGLVQLSLGTEEAFAGLARAKYGQIYGDVFGLRLSGPLGDPNFFAQILLALVPLALVLSWQEQTWRKRSWALACLLLVLSATVMTYSRGGAIALLLVTAASFTAHGRGPRRLGMVGVALLLASILLVPSRFRERLSEMGRFLGDDAVLVATDSSLEERLVLMGAAREMWLENPILGVGAGNYSARFGEYAERFGSAARDYEDPDAVRFAHNLYLEVGAETGTLGFCLFLGSLLLAFWSLAQGHRRLLAAGEMSTASIARALQISLAGYMVTSLFLHGDFERYLWLLLGFAGGIHAMSRREVSEETGASHAK